MKKYLFCFIVFVGLMFTTVTVAAHDVEYGIWHGEEDALILGTVTKIENNLCTIKVSEALPCKNNANDIYRMISLDQVPSEIIIDIDENYKYELSYNKRDKINEGDYIIASVDNIKGKWKANYPLYEVSSLDRENLEFLPENKKTSEAAAWEAFVHSKGEINDFMFDGEKVIAKVIDENGNEREKLIFGKEEIKKDENEENEEEKDSWNIPFIGGVIIIASIIIILKYKKA